MSSRHGTAGFTLFEMVLVLMLSATVVAMAGTLLHTSLLAMEQTQRSWGTLGAARYGSERMVRELRAVDRSTADPDRYAITLWNATTLAFTRSDETRVILSYDEDDQRVEITYPDLSPDPFLLADGVSSFTFSYLQADHDEVATTLQNLVYIEIALTLSDQGTLYPLQFGVALRNQPGWRG